MSVESADASHNRSASLAGDARTRVSGWLGLVASEAAAGALGFLVTVHFARRLHPAAFGQLEFALVVASWLLVFVRSGIEQVIYREAARHPRLVVPLTDLLAGIRCAGACAAFVLLAFIAFPFGVNEGWILLLGGLILLPSTLLPDLKARATGRLAILAFSQTLRAVAVACFGLTLVRRPSDVASAILAIVLAELVGNLPVMVDYARQHGVVRPRYRALAWRVLLQRGLTASVIRFLRVGLYAADVIILGIIASGEVGSYSAARRIVFALAALGLVIPSAFGPMLGRAWLLGTQPAREMLTRAVEIVVSAALPATVGLVLTGHRWMPVLFGADFVSASGPWLAWIALRLPLLLVASLLQAALVAFRHDEGALRLGVRMALLGLVTIPMATWVWGPAGAALAVAIVETVGTGLAWRRIRSLGAAPRLRDSFLAPVLGLLPMIAVCHAARDWSLVPQCIAAAAVYATAWGLVRSRLSTRAAASGCGRAALGRRSVGRVARASFGAARSEVQV